MPLVEVFDVSAVKIHDHKIARAPSAPESYPRIRVKHAKGGDVARFQWPWLEPHEVDPGLEMMAALIAGGERRALERVDAQPGEQSRRLPTYHHLRGVLLEGAVEQPLHAGDVAFVAPNELHQFRNTGETPLKFLCLIPHVTTDSGNAVSRDCTVE